MFNKLLVLLLCSTLVSSVVFADTAAQPPVASEVTVIGEISKVYPPEREIYVLSEGKKFEFYFNQQTTVSKGGAPLGYEALQKGQKVTVVAKKIGKRFDPISVTISE